MFDPFWMIRLRLEWLLAFFAALAELLQSSQMLTAKVETAAAISAIREPSTNEAEPAVDLDAAIRMIAVSRDPITNFAGPIRIEAE